MMRILPLIVAFFLLLLLLLLNGVSTQVQRHVDYCGADRLSGRSPDEQRILCKVFKNYTPLLRPVRNWTTSVRVGVSLAINQIFELDERNQLLITNAWIDQEWTDEFMVWNPDEFGISVIRIPARYLWLPDVMLYNNGAEYVNRFVQTRAMVKYDGTVFFPTPVKLYSSCTIDVTYFPFDMQICWLKFGSWSHDTNFVDIYGRVEDIDLSRFVNNGEWDVVDITHKRHLVHYSCCVELYSDLTFYIKIKRKVLYYVINIFFPSFIMSSLTLLTFLMPPDSGEKLTLGITVLLSFSVFMLSVTEKLPETSEYIPLISIYLCIVLSMLCFSITATIFVLSIYYCRPSPYDDLQRKRPPRLARRFTELFGRDIDLERFIKPEDSTLSQALRDAEEAIRQHYTTKRKRREAVVYPDQTTPLINERRLSTLSELLRKQHVFSSIKEFMEQHDEEERARKVVKAKKAKPIKSVDDYSQSNDPWLPMNAEEEEGDDDDDEIEQNRVEIIRIVNRLVTRAALEVRLERVVLEWKLFSAAIDRILFTIFVLMTTSAIVALLVIMPAVHRYNIATGRHVIRSGAVEYPEANDTNSFAWQFYDNPNKNANEVAENSSTKAFT